MNNGWLGFSLSPSAARGGYGYGDAGGGASASASACGDGEGSCPSPAAAAEPLHLVAMPPDGSLHYTSAPGKLHACLLLCL